MVRPALVRPALVRPALVRPALVRPALVRPALVRPALVRSDNRAQQAAPLRRPTGKGRAMKSNPQIIEALNARRIEELTAIDQYSAHLATAKRWGYAKFVAYLEERIADETKHMLLLEGRIRELSGVVTTGRIGTVVQGETLDKMLAVDGFSETDAIARYKETIALCMTQGDHVTRRLLEEIIVDENDHLVDIEAHLTQVLQMGIQNWLSLQV